MVPEHIELAQNYPNPFNPQTSIRYALVDEAQVSLEVVDVMGRRVALLVDEVQSAGRYDVTFDASDLPSGVYLYKLQAGSASGQFGNYYAQFAERGGRYPQKRIFNLGMNLTF